jgi:hypothetical protein
MRSTASCNTATAAIVAYRDDELAAMPLHDGRLPRNQRPAVHAAPRQGKPAGPGH